mmetsp:Transcript_9122/g.12954  ORF Transcript_9122/g.12954 Transcript_9122/m.12954 type:complete len:1162 (-) Transcript_9122:205-3690(-)|eukprot:CAMPEP_0184863476 /NCGR_PEP_ID=MMETSP0580-20130426/11281_1 /TAXON_ID=1118495 /ORGANISM="Dactyliosolen fragilissimus" /LENGTH=1161 /DNA_ID=CAMNT_0027361833 /DNA_START=34 /DNA_END=3519 /DNA_ORIENTATION=-
MAGDHGKRKKFHDKDKYYKLAKEQGYRSRAAFKLTQINRKFHFLENAKIVLDLCAAPGGWTQVASRTMSSSSASSTKPNASGGNIILAVDILPIRHIGSNVITLIGDITTDKTKAQIRQNLQGASADVVLCDGAPNVGASYDKDAYEQNEIALHALRCATSHLKRHGTFVTKLYRSADYSAYVWVAKMLFGSVQAVKPSASRSQSAEIFLVCSDYLDPTSIDPKMLDPKHVFEQTDGAATGGGDKSQSGQTGGNDGITIFHKKFDEKRRSRVGYDMTQLDGAMRNIGSIVEFIESTSAVAGIDVHDGKKGALAKSDPIRMLSVCTGISFSCHLCNDKSIKNGDNSDDDRPQCSCKMYLEHPLTTSEIKTCLSDLKVLNKADFKGLLNWRSKMREEMRSMRDKSKRHSKRENDEGMENEESSSEDDDHHQQQNSEEEEEEIQKDIEEMRRRRERERKRMKKRERRIAGKRRARAALGMDVHAIDVPDNDKIFSLATITSGGMLERAREVDLDKVDDKEIFPDSSDSEDDDYNNDANIHDQNHSFVAKHSKYSDVVRDEHGNIIAQGEEDRINEETGYSYRLDEELDEAYNRYLAHTKNGNAKAGTKMAKRSKKAMRAKAAEEAQEDQEMMNTDNMNGTGSKITNDTRTYAKMLNGAKDSDDDDDENDTKVEHDYASSDDDGFHATPVTPEQHEHLSKIKESNIENKKKKQHSLSNGNDDDVTEERNPLIVSLPKEATSIKTARWFSNPLFESIGNTSSLATMSVKQSDGKSAMENNAYEFDSEEESDYDMNNIEHIGSDDEIDLKNHKLKSKSKTRSRKEKKFKNSTDEDNADLTADKVLALMPKTDKQLRHEKRIKAKERQDRKIARRARLTGEMNAEFEVVSNNADTAVDSDEDSMNAKSLEKFNGLSDSEKKKMLEARALIKAGLGGTNASNKDLGVFEVVSTEESRNAGRPLPIIDTRKYDTDEEDYDSDDHAATLALGTMMLRKSKAKAFVDASYNRYAWNDPEGLPDWFADDENKHYRPQLPIPPELLARMKEKFISLSTRPIAKVAEARARKNKRAQSKLAAAKKKAQSLANSSELSETMKLKAISKAMRGQEASKPGKTYVVAKKGAVNKGGKGLKIVDKRMRSDKRGVERADKKRKKGKQGGLTGSKKRRHHK